MLPLLPLLPCLARVVYIHFQTLVARTMVSRERKGPREGGREEGRVPDKNNLENNGLGGTGTRMTHCRIGWTHWTSSPPLPSPSLHFPKPHPYQLLLLLVILRRQCMGRHTRVEEASRPGPWTSTTHHQGRRGGGATGPKSAEPLLASTSLATCSKSSSSHSSAACTTRRCSRRGSARANAARRWRSRRKPFVDRGRNSRSWFEHEHVTFVL